MTEPNSGEAAFMGMASYEQFTNITKFPYVLYHNFTSANEQVLQTWIAGMTNTSAATDEQRYKSSLDYFVSNCVDVTTTNEYTVPNSVMLQLFYPASQTGDSSDLFSVLKNNYTNPLPAIGPAKVDTTFEAFRENMQSTFGMVYYMLYKALSNKCDNATSAALRNSRDYLDAIGHVSLTQTSTTVDKVIKDELFKNSENFDASMTLQQYINNIARKLSASSILTNNVKKHLFFVAMYPYFVFRYFSNFVVPSSRFTATSKAPRDAYIRRAAILNMYMFQVYVLFAVYVLSARIAPASEYTTNLRMLMDSNVVNLFQQETLAMDASNQMKTLHEKTQNALQKTSKLDLTNREIEMSRNNIASTLGSEPGLIKAQKKAVALKWFWVSMLAVYVVFAVICIVIFMMDIKGLKAKVPSVMLMVGVVYIIGLCISGMVYVSKKF